MSRTPASSNRLGIGNIPHSGIPGPPTGPRPLEHQHRVRADRQVRVVDPGMKVGLVLEGECRPSMAKQRWVRGEGLDHRSVRCERAAQNRQACLWAYRAIERSDHLADRARRHLQ